ncbi:putative ATP binding protein [Corchorus olitorius]|uniref:ATP binding protein n=1 Tax=Corchorus olitorius TaxID=93759 RepID=A0A1R3IHI0_9ROSI|nr:putative ATP binding protein [Corchorus olitorius]
MKMKSQVSCVDEDDGESLAYFWWKTAAKSDECAKLNKLDFPDVSILTPRLRLFRELERLAVIAPNGLNELRHKLIGYRSGDFWVPTGGINKEDMNIPPVNTILLVGFSGSGKSSLINLMYSILGRSGLIPFAQTSSGSRSNYTTMYMEEHNVLRSMRSGFCVFDSRGFDYGNTREALEELSSWMSEGIHHNQLCLRYGDCIPMSDDVENDVMRSSSKFVQRRVNCVMFVANIAEIYKALKAGDIKPLEATRQLFCSPALRKSNENPLLILTHGDLLMAEERIDGRLKICEYLDITETNGVYDIVCLTEYGFLVEDFDPVSAYALTEAVYRALLISDRGHFPKRKFQDWALLILLWIMRFMGLCFAVLADIFSKLGHKHKLKMQFKITSLSKDF